MNGNNLSLLIDDNGPGIAPDKRQRILQRGNRADTSVAGQGIGLAVVVDIVSNYDGKLAIATSPLGGARFALTLPG